MKKVLSFLLILLAGITVVVAQPQKMTYQMVVRDNNNELIVNQQIGVKVSIIKDSANGPIAYAEAHTTTTNANALANIVIGTGIPLLITSMTDIKWGEHDYYLNIQIDPTGGTNYTVSGTQQLLSVPYSFYSERSKFVDTALYAYKSDTAVYSNIAYISFTANYADSARISNSAISANTANYADTTRIANTAISANSANTANTSISATYADTAFFLLNAQNSDTAKFAYSSDTADYAVNSHHSVYADTALYANNAANAVNAVNATYADSTQVANFAHNSDTAVYANTSYTSNTANYADSARISNSAISANTANYADTTRIANTAISATYADTAFFLMNAQNSDTAKFAYSSDTANYTANANHSIYADTALYANNSANAINAVNATYADSTQVADFAHNSDTAVYANASYTSNTAITANIANSALTANYADTADYNKLLNKPIGINKGDILYWETNDNSWHIIPAGNSGQVLTMGNNNVPQWSSGGGAQFSLPTVTTVAVGNISDSAATCDCSVTADGGFPVIAYGICWATVKNPTLNNSHTFDGSGIQNYTSYIENLNPAVTYYVRAYATNALGTAYGDTIGFTTSALPPTVTTTMASNVLNTSATTGGNVTFAGGLTVTERGVCWNTTGNPTMADSYTASGSGLGAFTITLTGLTPAVTYYVRAYAINSFDTAYGNEITFYTPTLPTVLTSAVNYSYGLTATCGGNVISDGNAPVTARGVCWSTTLWPTTSDSHTTDGTGTGVFSSNITGLSAITKYYVRAYATNAYGTAYGDTISFTTIGLPPTVTTTAASSITGTTAVTGGNVTSDGGIPVTERGICYNTTGSPTMADNVITSGSGTGSFTTNMTGLSGTTTYYVRAYAINALDTAYGTVESFTTPFACGSKIKDYDQNEYNTVLIGTQCWMQENLRTTHYANGTSITLGNGATSTTTYYRYSPNGNSSNVSTYGYLYSWYAMMNGASSSSSNPSGVQGVCPTGWHVPSNAEWTQLTNYISSQSQYWCGSNSTYIAKATASTSGWTSTSTTACAIGNNFSTNNATGLNIVPAGRCSTSYSDFGTVAWFWTTTVESSSVSYAIKFNYADPYITVSTGTHYWGRSVRCLKD